MVTSVTNNGESIDYSVVDHVLKISHSLLKEGENEIEINGTYSFTITVEEVPEIIIPDDPVEPETPTETFNPLWVIIPVAIVLGLALIAGVIVVVIVVSKKRRVTNGK